MILCEFTPAGYSKQYISNDDHELSVQWFSHIKSLQSIKFQTKKKYGGYAKPTFSSMTLWPEMFEDMWPPPATATVLLRQTDDSETGGAVLFDGTAFLDKWDQTGIGYRLSPPEFDVTISSGTAYNTTLDTVIDTLATALGLTVDDTNERATMPAVLHTTSKDQQAIDLLDDMCAWFCHGFKVIGTTLYLYDMKGSTTPIELTEFDVQPCEYEGGESISLITCEEQKVVGSSPNGDPEEIRDSFHTTGANIITAITDILGILETQVVTVNTKIDDNKPTVLDSLSLYDESTINPATTAAMVNSAIYNYDSLDLRLEGFGTITG